MRPIKIYALSTCIHCKKAKQVLDDCNAEYECVYVDRLTGDERKDTIAEIKKYNPSLSFPTLLFGDTVIVGFKEKEIRAELER